MNIIRSSAEIEAACKSITDRELLSLLGPYVAALEQFGTDLAAAVLIIEVGDTLGDVEKSYGRRLVVDDQFAFPVELIAKGERWWNVVWVEADDGNGLVLLIQQGEGVDKQLMNASEKALRDRESSDFP